MRGGARHSRVKLGTVVGAYLAWNRPARLFGGAPALATARARPESKEAVAERKSAVDRLESGVKKATLKGK